MKRVIITGATGMIGNIILHHCLQSEEVSEVISISRKPTGIVDKKLREVTHSDFGNYSAIENIFEKIDVAFFCIGVYTGAVPDAEFKMITVDYAISFADTLKRKSPDTTFCFLSGGGADLKEKSVFSFARYKGMAENHLMRLQFPKLYIFRPAYIYPVEKRNEPNLNYKLFRFWYPVINLLGKRFSIKSTELGEAMFNVAIAGADKIIFENKEIFKYLNRTS